MSGRVFDTWKGKTATRYEITGTATHEGTQDDFEIGVRRHVHPHWQTGSDEPADFQIHWRWTFGRRWIEFRSIYTPSYRYVKEYL
jgi:hypothetical protein